MFADNALVAIHAYQIVGMKTFPRFCGSKDRKGMIGGTKVEDALDILFVDGAYLVDVYGDAIIGFDDK